MELIPVKLLSLLREILGTWRLVVGNNQVDQTKMVIDVVGRSQCYR
jgi:hypothetical protein